MELRGRTVLALAVVCADIKLDVPGMESVAKELLELCNTVSGRQDCVFRDEGPTAERCALGNTYIGQVRLRYEI